MAQTLSEFQKAALAAIQANGDTVKPMRGGYWQYGNGQRAYVTVSPSSGTRILDLKTIRPLTRKGFLRRTNTQPGEYQDTYVVMVA